MKTSRFGIVVFGVLLAVMVGSVAHGQSQSSCVTGGAVPAGNAGLSQDCEALLDSLDTLRGSSTSLNWSDSRSISEWTGVSLGGSPQRVSSIKLMRQNLDGSIPADIGRVEKLVDLWLYHNSLQGPIPADLGNLADLRTLMLGWNNLSGRIPDTLNNLTLNRLWLRSNDFTGCVPYNLSLVPDNDLDHVPLPICGSSTQPTTPTLGETSETLSEMVRRVRPSVVRVEAVDHEGFMSNGSGFIVDTGEEGEAFILTNHHVIEEFQELLVVVEDGIRFTPQILVTDPRRDIALLQICCGEFSYVEFMDSDALYPGDEVIAIGYAAHDVVPRTFRPGRDIVPGEATVTRGIISAFRYDSAMDVEVVQHDAPINGGNSGGPLFSRDGRVVGMNTFNFSESGLEALSFAVLETTAQERLRLWDLGPSESFGPLSGNLDHRAGNLTDFSPDFTTNADEFAISAAFANPYAADEHPWDYGFMFGQNLFFMVHSDGIWMVGERLSETDAFMELHNGLAPQLLLGSGDTNTLELFVDGAYGWLYVNGQKVLNLEGDPYYPYGSGINLGGGGVSAHGGPVTVFTGLLPDSRRDGYATAFEYFEGTTYDHGADAPPPRDDRAALVALYNATDGPNWTNNTNWLSDAPIGEWHGVTADDNGRVVELVLIRNQLSGEIPPELGNLSKLTYLSLVGNELSGEIPPELGNLSKLTYLSLEGNKLTGEIPPELGSLSKLTYLHLGWNDLTGGIPPEFGGLSDLTWLDLSGTLLSEEIPPELGSLSKLTYLHLGFTEISGHIPPELGELSNLKELHLFPSRLSWCIPEAVRRLIPSLTVTDLSLDLPVCTSTEVFLSSGDAPRIYNDNLFVMAVDELSSWEIPYGEHVQRVRRFYEHFNDEFDFLIFLRNTGPTTSPIAFGGFYYGAMNDTEGIGKPIDSNHEDYELESPGTLQGIVRLSGALAMSAGPALHEIMHRWANSVVPTVWEGHWGFSSAYGQLGGLDIETLVDHGNGLYSADMLNRGSHTVPYSPIELYLAGLIQADEVPDLWVAEDGERAPSDEDLCVNGDGHCMFTATKIRTYTIEDIIAEHGERVPDYLNSQKDFRAAVVLLIDEDHPAIEWQVERVSADIAAFSLPGADEDDETYNFWEAMGGRATITMDGLSQFLKDTP